MSSKSNTLSLQVGDLKQVFSACQVSPNLVFTIRENKLVRPADEYEKRRSATLGGIHLCPQYEQASDFTWCILDDDGVFSGNAGRGANAPVCTAVLASEAVHVGCTVDVGNDTDFGGYDAVNHDTARLTARGGKMILRPIARKTAMRLYAFEDLATGLIAAIEAKVLDRLLSAALIFPDFYENDVERHRYIQANGYAPLPCLAEWLDEGHPSLFSHHHLDVEAQGKPCAVWTKKDDDVIDVSQLAALGSTAIPAGDKKRGSLFLFATAEDARQAAWNAMQPQLRRVLLHCCHERGIQPFMQFGQNAGLVCTDARSIANLLLEHPEEESWL